jgi:hypothetical protein
MITTTFSNHILNKLFAQSTSNPAWPSTNCYLGLSVGETAPTTDGDNFIEPSRTIGGTSDPSGYKRIDIKSFMSTATEQSITNNTEIHFLEAQSDWGVAKYFGIFATEFTDTPVFWGAINEEEDGTITGATIRAGSVAIIPAGQLTVTLE